MAIQKLKYLLKDESASDYVEKHSTIPATDQSIMMMNPDGIYFMRYKDFKQNQISIYPDAFKAYLATDNYNANEIVDYAGIVVANSLVFEYNANGTDVSTRAFAHIPAYNDKRLNIVFPVYTEDGVDPKNTDTVSFRVSGYLIRPGDVFNATLLTSAGQIFNGEADVVFTQNKAMGLFELYVNIFSDIVATDCTIALKITRIMNTDPPYLHSNVFIPYVNIQYKMDII